MKGKIVKCIMLFTLVPALASPLFGQGQTKPPRQNNGIRYHNGQVMLGSVHVYYIFYGNFVGTNEMITNPHHDKWYDNKFRENSDKCFNRFGQTYFTSNGARANIHLRGRDYLIQQNWVNADRGYCALSYP